MPILKKESKKEHRWTTEWVTSKRLAKKEQVKTKCNRLKKVIKSRVQINYIETTTTTQYKESMNLRSPSLEIQTTLADP